jgi:hypothetical protein
MKIITTTVLFACVFATGCAFDVMHVEREPAIMDISQTSEDSFVLSEQITVTPRGGYERELQQGTHWKRIGRITQGDVYKTRDQILTAEASNIYEANLVVSAGKIVGFYLPVESAFTPLEEPRILIAR